VNRSLYYNYIEEKLHVLAHRTSTGGKLNMLSLHMHSENFYLYLFNLLYNYRLENLNKTSQNVEGIDLIDHTNSIVVQVSSTNTKSKVESSLNKSIIHDYAGYTFKFISIVKESENLRKNTFLNPYSINFNPNNDIYDIYTILVDILSMEIDQQKKVYNFIKKELGNEVDIVKLDTNLASIINILAKEKWDSVNEYEQVKSFEINKKITFNNLDAARGIIDEYKLYYGRVNAKYSEFDTLGNNKSNSVLAAIKREYLKNKSNKAPDDIFFIVIDLINNKILNSLNFVQIPIDELELCVDILVVDAFIRCKIFENPEGYIYATS
jgi:hypothetical protein